MHHIDLCTVKNQNCLTEKKDNRKGFTLLELLICMLIIGVMLKLGVGAFNVATKNASDTVQTITDAVLQAKSDSLYTGESRQLIFYKNKIELKNKEGVEKVLELDDSFPIISINEEIMHPKGIVLSVNSFGLIEESLLIIDNMDTTKSIYIPSIGKILAFDYFITIQDIYDNIL